MTQDTELDLDAFDAIAAEGSPLALLLAEARRLRAKVRAVRNLHFTMTGARCEECAFDQWPCDTVRALDAAGLGVSS